MKYNFYFQQNLVASLDMNNDLTNDAVYHLRGLIVAPYNEQFEKWLSEQPYDNGSESMNEFVNQFINDWSIEVL